MESKLNTICCVFHEWCDSMKEKYKFDKTMSNIFKEIDECISDYLTIKRKKFVKIDVLNKQLFDNSANFNDL
nr:hypothetical protein Datr000042 [Darna trima granulovirus]